MYEMNFHKTAILTFFNEHKIDKFYNFETLYHNTIPFSNGFEEKISIFIQTFRIDRDFSNIL